MEKKKLDEIVGKHGKWLCNKNDGERANLCDAGLCDADLRNAILRNANLRNANLCDADLRGADLRNADLCYADLCYADLRDADLRGADLRNADLCDADLRGADFRNAKEIPQIANCQTNILPDGDIVGWKKANSDTGECIVKLLIESATPRSNATGRKCRAKSAKVLEIFCDTKEIKKAVSKYDRNFAYEVGKTVTCDKWENDRWIECGGGIHFFITRYEAEIY